MTFDLQKSHDVLSRTPLVLDTLLQGISEDWIFSNEGPDTWSPYDILGHLIHGEKTDWIPRLEIILSSSSNKTFKPFDRFAQAEASKGKTVNELLYEFKMLRQENIRILTSKNITQLDLKRTGIHPTFGEVTSEQLLSTWVAHDLGHISQVTRVMARQYKHEVGPWIEFLPILTR